MVKVIHERTMSALPSCSCLLVVCGYRDAWDSLELNGKQNEPGTVYRMAIMLGLFGVPARVLCYVTALVDVWPFSSRQ